MGVKSVALAKGYSFEDFFKKSETQEKLRIVLGSHFATSMQDERAWHAGTNPSAEGEVYRAGLNGGQPLPVGAQ